MRRHLAKSGLTGVAAWALVACNGILGIDPPTLVSGADASDAKASDGAGGHDATRDATHDATNDVRKTDSGRDAGSDAPVILDAGHDATRDGDAAADAAAIFDGSCTCEGDACAVVVVGTTPSGVSRLAPVPSGICFYAVNDDIPQFPGELQCVTFDGTRTVVDDNADESSAIVAFGDTIYWVNFSLNQVRTCTLPNCVPEAFGGPGAGSVEANLAGGAHTIYWGQSNGIWNCPVGDVCLDGGTPIPESATFGKLTANDLGVYWQSTSTLSFCATSGCGSAALTLVDAGGTITALAATDQSLFWADGNLWRCPVSDAGVCASPPVIAAATVGVDNLVVDSTGAYWTRIGDPALSAVGPDGGPTRTVVAVQASFAGAAPLAVGASCVFWAENVGDGGVIKATAKRAP